MQLVTRAEAKASGKTRYFTGKLCPHGHVAERVVASKDCVTCHLIRCSKSGKLNRVKRYAARDRWRKDNPEKHTEISRRAAKKFRAKDPERHRANAAQWKLNNPDKNRETTLKWRAKNTEKIRADVKGRVKKWRSEFPEKRRATENVRRGRKMSAEGHHTSADLMDILKRQNHRCCGISCADNISDTYTVDHIRPLSRGGSNWPNNLQLLCRSCNSKKGTKTNEEWRVAYVQASSGGLCVLLKSRMG